MNHGTWILEDGVYSQQVGSFGLTVYPSETFPDTWAFTVYLHDDLLEGDDNYRSIRDALIEVDRCFQEIIEDMFMEIIVASEG